MATLLAEHGGRNDMTSSSAEPGGESTSAIRSRCPSRRPPITQPDECVVASLRRRQLASDIDRQPPETAPPTGSSEVVWDLRAGTWSASDCDEDGADS